MYDPIWTFTRRGDILTITRTPTADGVQLIVLDGAMSRSYFFTDITPLTAFQAELEASLLRNGWSFASFASFAPERRSTRERRRFTLRSAEEREDRLRDRAGQRAGAPRELEDDGALRRKG